MKKEAFVIGDIHGMYHLLEELLRHWQPETQQLIFVGDLVDRGPDSLKTIQKVRELQASVGAICVTGNHEMMLWETLVEPERYYPRYQRNGGLTTISELLDETQTSLEEVAGEVLSQRVKASQPWLQAWLESLPLYYQFGDFLIVHAGVNLELANWQDSTRRDLVWIRESFHSQANQTGLKIIFGHTPVNGLNEDGDASHIWESQNRYGIDGGAVYGGYLHAIRINQHEVLETFSIRTHE